MFCVNFCCCFIHHKCPCDQWRSMYNAVNFRLFCFCFFFIISVFSVHFIIGLFVEFIVSLSSKPTLFVLVTRPIPPLSFLLPYATIAIVVYGVHLCHLFRSNFQASFSLASVLCAFIYLYTIFMNYELL